MKKWLLVLLLLPCFVQANDINAMLDRTIAAADTGIGSAVYDTAYSEWYNISRYRWLQFAVSMAAHGTSPMFAFTADSFFFNAQTSADQLNIVSTIAVDTLLAAGYGNSPVNIDKDATVFGPWMRLQVIYHDSVLASTDTALGNEYKADVTLWFMGK